MRPREPTISALTIRGDAPRWVTSMPRSEPLTSPPSWRRARLSVVRTVQRWRGETLSYGSSTDLSHGFGEPPSEFSTFSVLPPLVLKKYVVTGLPSNVTTSRAVAAIAASVWGV